MTLTADWIGENWGSSHALLERDAELLEEENERCFAYALALYNALDAISRSKTASPSIKRAAIKAKKGFDEQFLG